MYSKINIDPFQIVKDIKEKKLINTFAGCIMPIFVDIGILILFCILSTHIIYPTNEGH